MPNNNLTTINLQGENTDEASFDFEIELVLPSPTDPMAVARDFVGRLFLDGGGKLKLRYWRSGWWLWRTTHWVEIDDSSLRSIVYKFTEHAKYLVSGPRGVTAEFDWKPTRNKVSDVVDALRAVCILPNELDQPCWIDDRETGVIVAVGNGLLEVNRRALLPHTPEYFNQTAVPFDYNRDAPVPTKWLAFLDELWPQQPESINRLGEWFGYVISGHTYLHKICLIVGPTRGGKGAMARVLTALIGRKNVAGPTLNSLGGEFGLAPFIGKPLAVISDARFSGKDANVVIERLLSISGEDTLTVNRKYKEQWTGKLPTRIQILSNELPRLGDASSAIIGRLVLLLLQRSWLGKEDYTLERGLHEQLPGILNWALDGLERLTVTNNNTFTHVATVEDAVCALHDLASPVAAFVREKCVLGFDQKIAVDTLYSAYCAWCLENGHMKSSKQVFGRNLHAAYPAVKLERPRTDEPQRPRQYVGIDVTL